MRRLWLFLWCAGLFACRGVTAPTVPRHQEFTLTPRQMASIDGADIRVRFVGVQGDSRCPADALCIQRGDAIVTIEVVSDRGATVPYDLHTEDLKPVRHDWLAIVLVSLAPYPFSGRTIQPDEYRATLRVDPWAVR